MLSKKFQLVKTQLDEKNFTLARNMLVEIAKQPLTDTAEALYRSLYSKLPHDAHNNNAIEKKTITAKCLSELDEQPIEPGISIVSCCMNRNENLVKALKTWLKLPVDEIVIVDWSSNTPVTDSIKDIQDDRIKIIRVENEHKWILTYGFNVGLRFASYSKIYKFDADIEVTPDFITENHFDQSSFVRGNWKFALDKGDDEQKFVNGSFGACKESLKEVGYYNELITTYGWDDSDIYNRLSSVAGCATRYIKADTILHLEQEQEERLKYQAVNKSLFLGHFEPTEYYNMRNKYLTSLLDNWNFNLLHDYTIQKTNANHWKLTRTTQQIIIPANIVKDAEKYAMLEMAGWISPELKRSLSNNERYMETLENYFAEGINSEVVNEHIYDIIKAGPQFKTKSECILNILHNKGQSHKNIECEGLDQTLQILSDDQLFTLKPESTLNKPANLSTKENIDKTERKLIFVTSLYDEKRPERLKEYVYCIEQNVKYFDFLVIYYEQNDKTLYSAIKNKLDCDGWNKVIFVIYNKRPTFDFLFNTTDILFPHSIICVANADIAVDDSVSRIKDNLHQNAFWTLSRNEVDITSKASKGLIMTDLGIPNTFSADMWIYESPRKHPFKASFPIGTYHCDSFMNYYIAQSSYELYNPCLDVNIFHIHDPIFNSSEEKAIRDKKLIDEKLMHEVELNNGVYPLMGSKWCKAIECDEGSFYQGNVDWYSTVVKLYIDEDGSNLFQIIVATLLCLEAFKAVKCMTSIWLILPVGKEQKNIYRSLLNIVEVIGDKHIYIGIKEQTKVDINKSYESTEFSTDDLINTVDLIRNKKIGRFLSFTNPMCLTECFFGIDYDPHYIGNHRPLINDITTYKLLKLLTKNQLNILSTLISAPENMEGFIPFKTDIDNLLNTATNNGTFIEQSQPSITFITSIFKGSEFMRGYLENIAIAANEANGEVIIIDANSPENEYEIFEQFITEYPELKRLFIYEKLTYDPGLYNCWKLAIKKSSAKYISNANLDDRRSPFQAKILIDYLDLSPEYSGAASAMRATVERNTSWYKQTENQYWFNQGYKTHIDFDALYIKGKDGVIKSQNIMHCMPVWKKSLHKKHGFFNEEKYGTSADWAFWLECAKNGEVFHLVPQVLSQYYINEQSHNRINDPNGIKENMIVLDYFGLEQKDFIQQ